MLPGRGDSPVGFQLYYADLPALPYGVWPGYEGGAVQLLDVFGLIP